MSRIQKVIIGVGASAMVIGLAVVMVYLFAESNGGRGHRSDYEMVIYFKEHKQQFEELLQMYQADFVLEGANGLGGDWSESLAGLGVDGARAERYQSLRRELDVEILMRYSDSEVLFIMSSRGFVGGGSMKGYTYSAEPPTPLVESTEEITVGPHGVVYRHIEDGWYLTYEWS